MPLDTAAAGEPRRQDAVHDSRDLLPAHANAQAVPRRRKTCLHRAIAQAIFLAVPFLLGGLAALALIPCLPRGPENNRIVFDACYVLACFAVQYSLLRRGGFFPDLSWGVRADKEPRWTAFLKAGGTVFAAASIGWVEFGSVLTTTWLGGLWMLWTSDLELPDW